MWKASVKCTFDMPSWNTDLKCRLDMQMWNANWNAKLNTLFKCNFEMHSWNATLTCQFEMQVWTEKMQRGAWNVNLTCQCDAHDWNAAWHAKSKCKVNPIFWIANVNANCASQSWNADLKRTVEIAIWHARLQCRFGMLKIEYERRIQKHLLNTHLKCKY